MILACAVLMLGAGPATKPTTQPATGLPAQQRKITELIARVAELEAANKRLAAENEELKKQAATTAAKATDASGLPQTPEDLEKALVDKVQPGMSLEQVVAAIGKASKETRDGSFVVRDFRRFWQPSEEQSKNGIGVSAYVIRGWFGPDGKLADVKGFIDRNPT